MTHPINPPLYGTADERPALSFIEQLEADALAAEQAAEASKLTPDEQRAQQAIARIEKAREEKAAADRARRSALLVEREARARTQAGTRYLVKGIDVVDLFPLGTVPAGLQFPGDGVIVVRSPEAERMNSASAEIEHKKRPMAAIMADLLLDSTVEPDPRDPAHGAKLRAFFDSFTNAATAAGSVVLELGGMKSRGDKRGRS